MPVICVLSLVLTFNLNRAIGFVLLAVVLVVLILAFFMIRSASPLFRRLQKLLDRMSTVFLENLTGVRVVRAFNNEKREKTRMDTAFTNYAQPLSGPTGALPTWTACPSSLSTSSWF